MASHLRPNLRMFAAAGKIHVVKSSRIRVDARRGSEGAEDTPPIRSNLEQIRLSCGLLVGRVPTKSARAQEGFLHSCPYFCM